MNKYYDSIQNKSGDGQARSRVQVLDSSGDIVDIHADDSGTNFTDSTGANVNYCEADEIGFVEFYWDAEAGQVLQTLDSAGNLVRTIPDFANNYVLNNLGGAIPQSQVTDLTDDLDAKVSTTTLAETGGAALVGMENGATAQQAIAVAANPTALIALADTLTTDSFIRTTDGYLYKVVTTGEDLTTAGSMKLQVKPVAGYIHGEAFGIDKTNTTDATAKLNQIGVAAIREGAGIRIGEGSVKITGSTNISWLNIDDIKCTCEFIRVASETVKFLLGGNASATAHSEWEISGYDAGDPFALTRTIDEIVRIQGAKHFTLNGRPSKVMCYANGSVSGAESGGYGQINAEIYTLEIQSLNGGWFNHVNVQSQRLTKFLSYRSDGSYQINGWTVHGLFELANAEISLDYISDLYLRGRFETTPVGFITMGANTINCLVLNANGNGAIQPWYQDWKAVWVSSDGGKNNRFLPEAYLGLEHRLMARFDRRAVVSDGTVRSASATGWMKPAMTFKGKGVNFSTINEYVLASEWVLAKKGDIFYTNAVADVAGFRSCLEIWPAAGGTAPATDPAVVSHAFANWAYHATGTAAVAAGSYYTNTAMNGYDAWMYIGADDAYYVRCALRVFTANAAVVQSAAIWWTGRSIGTRQADLVKPTECPAILTAAPTTPAPIGTLAFNGTKLIASIKYEETFVRVAIATSATSLNWQRTIPAVVTGDLVSVQLDDGTWYSSTIKTPGGGTVSSFIDGVFPSGAAVGNLVRIGRWSA